MNHLIQCAKKLKVIIGAIAISDPHLLGLIHAVAHTALGHEPWIIIFPIGMARTEGAPPCSVGFF